MKVLSATHITKDITVEQFNGVVASITRGNFLGFSDDKLPFEERTHNKALHISLRCVNTLFFMGLMDTRSSMNIILKTTLLKLSLEGIAMKPNTLIVNVFYGSRRAIIGEVGLSIRIGPTTFTITF